MSKTIPTSKAPSGLEERFQEPPGWRWHGFERAGRQIRFGSVFPADSIPDAVVVCFPGVGEFAEKYFETARNILDCNMAFWVMDWLGQGQSGRYLDNAQKRHGGSFKEDIEDMHYFILEYIKHSSVHPDRGRIPLALLAHSMGANICLHFLAKHPQFFECAAFTAPMIGIKAFKNTPNWLSRMATQFCHLTLGKKYIPGGADWGIQKHTPEGPYKLSSDPVRGSVHNAWCQTDERLKVGDVTLGWVHHAHQSCIQIQHPQNIEAIDTPCFFGIAEHEHLVDNAVARTVIGQLKNATCVDIPNSHHEILMDVDAVRDVFIDGFKQLIKEKILDRPETLKPF